MVMWLCRLKYGRLFQRRRWGAIMCLFFCGFIFTLLSLAFFAYFFRHQLLDTFIRCSITESKQFIHEMCELYKQDLITGSLCRPLCETGEVQFDSCTNFHAGKEVHHMYCSNFCQPQQTIHAVLKCSRINITNIMMDYPNIMSHEDDQKDILNVLKHQIKQLVESDLGFLPFRDPDIITVMWEDNFDQFFSDLAQANAAYRTVILLMDQPEYKIVKALRHTGTVPEIYGTCGPMYLEESCPSGPLDEQFQFVTKRKPAPASSDSWQERATAAVSLLKLLHHFDHDFPEPLHICDAKGSNFGVCADGRVKMIDMDSVFFNSTMFNIFNLSGCKTNEHCNFFDCGGWCNTKTGKCYPVKTNNNLQLVCKKVLTSPFSAFFDTGGALSGAPASIAKELHALLEKCAAQTSEEAGIPMFKPPAAFRRKLIDLLKRSVLDSG